MANKIEKKIEDLIVDLFTEPYELVDLEFVKEAGDFFLRVYIDKAGGLSMEDIEEKSKEINSILDREDPIEQSYFLEVSSPGLERTLKKEKDFIRESGKTVALKTYKPIGDKKEFEGILQGLNENGDIVIEVDGEEKVFKKSDVAVVKLKLNF